MSAVKIISGVVTAAVIFIALGVDYFVLGGESPSPWAFSLLIFAVLLLGQSEFYCIVRKCDIHPLHVLGLLLGGAYLAVAFAGPYMAQSVSAGTASVLRLEFQHLGNLILMIAVVVPLVHFVVAKKSEHSFESSMATTFGLIYVVFLGSYMLGIRFQSFWYALLFVCTAKSCDIGAYFTGSNLGRHKLHPVSPNKTVEGSIGGIVVGTVIAVLVTQLFLRESFPLYLALIYGVVVSVASQVGDLGESLIKRRCGVKDSGKLIPGSGGLLDFADCLLFSAPVAYYLVDFAIR